MRKTVLFIRFALCIAIVLVGSSLFATARAISVPNPFVKAQEVSVQKLHNDHSFASVALAASNFDQDYPSNAISSTITSQQIVEPILVKGESPKTDTTEPKPATVTPQASLISAAVGESVVTPEDNNQEPIIIEAIISPVSVPPTPTETVSTSGGLQAETLFSMINATRQQAGLAAFEKNDDLCSAVATRAPEIHNEIYGSSYMHAGFMARYAGSGKTENIISMRTEQEALNWWLNSPVHRSSLLGSYKYSCLACSGDSCSEIFSN